MDGASQTRIKLKKKQYTAMNNDQFSIYSLKPIFCLKKDI